MGDWYDVGLTVGLGLAAGLLLAGLVAGRRYGLVAAVVAALALAATAGALVDGWTGVPGAVAGAVIGALSAWVVTGGALRRGATSGGLAVIVAGAAVAVALLALIPFVGYVLAALVPGLAVRRARREPERHAGLRTLAR